MICPRSSPEEEELCDLELSYRLHYPFEVYVSFLNELQHSACMENVSDTSNIRICSVCRIQISCVCSDYNSSCRIFHTCHTWRPASWTWTALVSTSKEHAADVSTSLGYSAKLLPLICKRTGRSDLMIVATTSVPEMNFSSLILTGVTGCGFP